jgi:hypothetical protein
MTASILAVFHSNLILPPFGTGFYADAIRNEHDRTLQIAVRK